MDEAADMDPVKLNERQTNWVVAVSCFKYLKQVIRPFIDATWKAFRNGEITIKKKRNCHACKRAQKKCCQKCFDDMQRDFETELKRCNLTTCEARNSGDASSGTTVSWRLEWSNVDMGQMEDPWELAKCFMTAGRHLCHGIEQIDCTGLLQLCLNFEGLATKTSLERTLIRKNLRYRNELFHSGEQEIDESKRKDIIRTAIALVQCKVFKDAASDHDRIVEEMDKLNKSGVILYQKDLDTALKDAVKDLGIKYEAMKECSALTDKEVGILKKQYQKLDGIVKDINKWKDAEKNMEIFEKEYKNLETDLQKLRDKTEECFKKQEKINREQKQINKMNDERHQGFEEFKQDLEQWKQGQEQWNKIQENTTTETKHLVQKLESEQRTQSTQVANPSHAPKEVGQREESNEGHQDYAQREYPRRCLSDSGKGLPALTRTQDFKAENLQPSALSGDKSTNRNEPGSISLPYQTLPLTTQEHMQHVIATETTNAKGGLGENNIAIDEMQSGLTGSQHVNATETGNAIGQGENNTAIDEMQSGLTGSQHVIATETTTAIGGQGENNTAIDEMQSGLTGSQHVIATETTTAIGGQGENNTASEEMQSGLTGLLQVIATETGNAIGRRGENNTAIDVMQSEQTGSLHVIATETTTAIGGRGENTAINEVQSGIDPAGIELQHTTGYRETSSNNISTKRDISSKSTSAASPYQSAQSLPSESGDHMSTSDKLYEGEIIDLRQSSASKNDPGTLRRRQVSVDVAQVQSVINQSQVQRQLETQSKWNDKRQIEEQQRQIKGQQHLIEQQQLQIKQQQQQIEQQKHLLEQQQQQIEQGKGQFELQQKQIKQQQQQIELQQRQIEQQQQQIELRQRRIEQQQQQMGLVATELQHQQIEQYHQQIEQLQKQIKELMTSVNHAGEDINS